MKPFVIINDLEKILFHYGTKLIEKSEHIYN